VKRNPIVVTVLLGAIFTAAGYNAGTRLSASPTSSRNPTTKPTRVVVDATKCAHGAVVAPGKNIFMSDRSRNRSTVSVAATPRHLSDDASALLAETCDLQLLAQSTALSLDSRQWSAFAGIVLRAQAVRQTYEAQIATSNMISPGEYRVEIPVYAAAGDVLRRNFNAELRAELGEATAADVLAKLGGKLESRFAGFGVSAQILDITAKPDAAPRDIQITRTVTYWNSVEDGDQPTTRREIHFPAYEDPTGDSWSALIAAVKA